jgi:hypothetical protein
MFRKKALAVVALLGFLGMTSVQAYADSPTSPNVGGSNPTHPNVGGGSPTNPNVGSSSNDDICWIYPYCP